MKHLILGTAGHVDHGKTSLVKALTGIDCDTHKEEKLRGITINLGFAHLDLPSGDSLSIVDVPGHRDFIHTMVAGASGIDMALLVVAADGGVMPQTREHLQIMQTLGIRAGLVAVTRIDLADETVAELALEEIVELTKGTFLEKCPVVKVCSKTGEGIESLKGHIASVAAALPDRPGREVFRMYIDRIFSVAGFGTVVTGSVIGGSICAGAGAYLLPGSKELRVRRIERHGHEVGKAIAGDRASLNLVGLSRDEFVRGMLVADRDLRTTTLLDCRLTLFQNSRPMNLWSQSIFLMGSYEAQCRIHLLDRDLIYGGETGLVQIHLPDPCVAQASDRFVLRSTSSDVTIGGGEIIDPAPLHHRRRPQLLVTRLAQLASGKLPELVAAQVRKYRRGVSHRVLAETLNVASSEILSVAGSSLPPGIVGFTSENLTFLLDQKEFESVTRECVAVLGAHHRRNPLSPEGKTAEELSGILGMDTGAEGQQCLKAMLKKLSEQGLLKGVNHSWALASHSVTISPHVQKNISSVERFLKDCGMRTPVLAELESFAKQQGIDQLVLKQILRHLVVSGAASAIEGSYIHRSVVGPCRTKLLGALCENPRGLTVAQFRDLVGGNRKICLLLYALFDNEGITERQGDVRVITSKGMGLLKA